MSKQSHSTYCNVLGGKCTEVFVNFNAVICRNEVLVLVFVGSQIEQIKILSL